MAFTVKMIGDFTLQEEIDGLILDWTLFKKEFVRTGRNIHRFMIEYLKANTKGSSNASEQHVHKEIDFNFMDEPFRVTVEIGDIAKLDANAPWWKLQNYGGTHPMAGRFVPGAWSGRKFRYDPGSGRGMVVSSGAVISPINYIENAEHFGTSAYQTLIAASTVR